MIEQMHFLVVEHRDEITVFKNSHGEVSIMVRGQIADPEVLSLPMHSLVGVAHALLKLAGQLDEATNA